MTTTINGTGGVSLASLASVASDVQGTASALSSVNGGQLAGLRNRFINGGMQISQRGSNGYAAAAAAYGGCDRYVSTVSATTVSAVALQVYAGPAYTTTGYAHQIGNVITTGATVVQLHQRIESINAAPLTGKQVTFSGKVLQVTGASQTVSIGFSRANATNDFSAQTAMQSTTQVIPNNTWTTFSFTTTFTDTGLANGLLAYTSYSLGAQTNTGANTSQFYFADWQLETGSIATPFEQRPIGMELALCQRYYEVVQGPGALIGSIASTTTGYAGIKFSVTKRAVPTLIAAAGTYNIFSGTAGNTASTNPPTFIGATTDGCMVLLTGYTGLTLGQVFLSTGTTNPPLGFSAEL